MFDSVGQKIRELRLTKGFSQTELGDRLNLSQESISEIERGKRNLKIETLHALAIELDADIGDLYPDFHSSRQNEEARIDFHRFSPALCKTLNEIATWPLEDQNELNQMLRPLLRLRESAQ